ncbi:MAG: hypothetical protein P8M72_01635 [Gammaproteobacteria bacterium]|nr:hypothetical protein [Gammaproteobacteria bacterium]
MHRQLARVSILFLAVIAAAWSAFTFPHAATSNSVLFDREIVRILNIHCAMCHMSGGPAEDITTWQQTWLQRDAIHDQVLARHMPPWAAVSGYGSFKNTNQLTLREKRFIVSWVEGLGPRNTGEVFFNLPGTDGAQDEPVTASFDTAAWRLGDPGRVVRVAPDDVLVGTLDGSELLQAFVTIDPFIQEETFLSGLEFLPDDRRNLHAVVFSVADSGQWLATWTPWYGHREFSEDSGVRLAPGQHIQADYLMSESNSGMTVNGSLGLHFANTTTARQVQEISVESQGRGTRLQTETTLENETTVIALWPEYPAGTHSLEISARHPNGRVEILLLALDIPEQWPTSYILESPITLPAGSRLTVTANAGDAQSTALSGMLRLTLSNY